MKDAILFLGQYARRWRTIGAFAPSGPALVRRLVRAAGDVPDGKVIVELGPGTGVLTRELVRVHPKARVVAVEVVDAFADRLATRFPTVAVVRGCASRLNEHLAGLGIAADDVAVVVSGLPMLSLPGDLPQRVMGAMAAALRPGRRYVQFSYSGRAWRGRAVPGFRPLGLSRVWPNLPPAVVLTFERDGASPG